MFEAVFSGLFMAALFVFPAYLVSGAITGSPKNSQAAVDKAITRGHVVRAVLIKTGPPVFGVHGLTTPGPHRKGVYEYTYKGKRYKYHFWSGNPPTRLTLYFLKNPRKATVAGAMYNSEFSWIRMYIIVAALFILLGML